MKKLLTLCSKEITNCIKTKGSCDRYVIERDYSDNEYNSIRSEADRFEIYVFSSWGYDYGYGTKDSSTSESSKRIEDYQIVVTEDGMHFAGVADTSDYYSFNKVSYFEEELCVALIDDPVDSWRGLPLISKDGSSFSSDDHEKWDYTYYYLRERTK